MIPAIKNRKLKKAFASLCSQPSIPIFLLSNETALSEELIKR
jgi:hypothetical protein